MERWSEGEEFSRKPCWDSKESQSKDLLVPGWALYHMEMMEQRIEVGDPKDREESCEGEEAICLGSTASSVPGTVPGTQWELVGVK